MTSHTTGRSAGQGPGDPQWPVDAFRTPEVISVTRTIQRTTLGAPSAGGRAAVGRVDLRQTDTTAGAAPILNVASLDSPCISGALRWRRQRVRRAQTQHQTRERVETRAAWRRQHERWSRRHDRRLPVAGERA